LELFNCNYDYKRLKLDENLPSFYKQIILYWQEISSKTPLYKQDILLQTNWNNRYITVNKCSIFYPNWFQAGIKLISDIFHEKENRFLSYNSFCNKFRIKCNFLQYYSLLSCIPSDWKILLKNDSAHSSPVATSVLTCKRIYDKLLACEPLPPQ